MKIMTKALWATGLLTLSAQIYADCTISQNYLVEFPNRSSIDLGEGKTTAQSFNSGLKCSGALGLANTAYIKYKVETVIPQLINSNTNEALSFSLRDSSNNPVSNGTEKDLTEFDFITIFNGPDNSIPFYATLNAGQTVSPGVYESKQQFRVRWYYSVPNFAFGGGGIFHESPRFRRPGTFNKLEWGAGEVSSTYFRIKIERDCRISVQDVNLGTAVFANQLEPVYTEVGVRCSSRTPYSVAINDGSNSNGGQRRLRSANSPYRYINYDIYKNTLNERWGSNGQQTWSSARATQNAGNHDGRTVQRFRMRTEVIKNNPDNLPGGQYKDNLRMEIRF